MMTHHFKKIFSDISLDVADGGHHRHRGRVDPEVVGPPEAAGEGRASGHRRQGSLQNAGTHQSQSAEKQSYTRSGTKLI
jgi:hypothetical protein